MGDQVPEIESVVMWERIDRSGGVMVVATAIAVVAHVILLAYLEIDLPDWVMSPALIVTINRSIPNEPRHRPIVAPEAPPVVPSPGVEAVEEPTPTDTVVPRAPPPGVRIREVAIPRGIILYTRALAAMRDWVPPEVSTLRQFSVADLPIGLPAEPDWGVPVVIAPVLVTRPGRTEMRDSQGYNMVRTSDGFGRVTCRQERGEWSDWGVHSRAADKMKNPTLYYPLPAANCGHLK